MRRPLERGLDKRRLERAAGGARTFWEISSLDRTVEERWGDVGGKARKRTSTFPSAADAEAEVERLVATKLSEGFAPRAVPPPPAPIVATKRLINPGLEMALAQTPDDVAAWQVYGDWLCENGEAWGEVIGHATQSKSTVLHRSAAEKLWFQNIRGCDLDWKRLGVVISAELKPSVRSCGAIADGLSRMLAHPAGRLVRFLTIEIPNAPVTFQPVIDAIAAAGPLPLLELVTLRRRGHVSPSKTPIANLTSLWAAAPRLDRLTLGWCGDADGTPCTLGNIAEASRLETLSFEGCGLPGELVIELGAAELPNVTHLELTAGPADHGSTITLVSLAGILEGRGLPKLETLMLKGLDFETGLIEALARSPLVRRLATLWLVDGVLHEPAARAITDHADAFRHLDLALHDNYFTTADLAMIGKQLTRIEAFHQRAMSSPRRPKLDHGADQ